MSTILSPLEFRILEGLRLAPRRSFHGRIRGERLTRRKGISIEFADYRDYAEGDDLRHLDWNVLARLQTPVMRTYQDEQDLGVYLAIDTSRSMDFGEPSKLETAKRLAAAFALVALNGQDAVYPIALPARGVGAANRSRASFPKVARWIEGQSPNAGSKSLSAALREHASAGLRPGMFLIFSDALDPQVVQNIHALASAGHEVCLVQILAPEEVDPDLEGDLRLLDAESGSPVELTANRDAIRTYRRNLALHNKGLSDALRRLGGRYVQVLCTDPVETVFKDRLRKDGWFA